jgi:hypothetical protein
MEKRRTGWLVLVRHGELYIGMDLELLVIEMGDLMMKTMVRVPKQGVYIPIFFQSHVQCRYQAPARCGA